MKSSGTPSESYSRNASSPGQHACPARPRDRATSSSRGSPAVSTASKRSSSLRIDLHDRVAVRLQLRIRVAHLARRDVDQRVEERLGEAELLAVPHRAPHDLAQHVAAPFVRRHDAVGDQERHRAQVVGDDAHRDVGRVVDRRAVACARRARRSPSRIGVKRSVS